VLWPDTGKWYNADVIKVNVKKKTAVLFYVDSEEREDINLYEAMLNMEVSWPYRGGMVGKTPLPSVAAMPKKKRKEQYESESDSDVPLIKKKKSAPAKKVVAVAVVKKVLPPQGGPSDANRLTLREKLLEAMHLARDEAKDKTDFGIQKSEDDCEEAARAAEEALHAVPEHRNDRKKYNDKARSLLFNLKDLKNPSLRARVLSGELKPETLAQMTPAELARKDLREMRAEREANIGEDAFFKGGPVNTRLVKTSKGEEVVLVGGGEEVEEGDGLGNRRTASVTVPSVASDDPEPDEDYTPRAPGMDQTGSVTFAATTAPGLQSFEEFAAAGMVSSDESSDEEEEDKEKEPENAEDDEYDPSKGFNDDADDAAPAIANPVAQKPRTMEVAQAPSLPETAKASKSAPATKVLDGLLRKKSAKPAPGAWNGTLILADRLAEGKIGSSRWRAAAVGGEGASLVDILPKSMEIKNRISLEKAEDTNGFLSEILHGRSTTRGVTLAVAVPETADDTTAASLTKWYVRKKQYGVVSISKKIAAVPLEMYLVPQGKMCDRLLKRLGGAGIDAAGLAEKGPSAMLWCAVHPTGVGPNAVKKKAQRSAASLNAFSGGDPMDEDGGTPPRVTNASPYQSTQILGYPPGAPPDVTYAYAPPDMMNQYHMPAQQPPPTYLTRMPPPPVVTRRPDAAEDFLNSTFGVGSAAAPYVVADVPPPPFARVAAEVPRPPFGGNTGVFPPGYDGSLPPPGYDSFGGPSALLPPGYEGSFPPPGWDGRGAPHPQRRDDRDRHGQYPPGFDDYSTQRRAGFPNSYDNRGPGPAPFDRRDVPGYAPGRHELYDHRDDRDDRYRGRGLPQETTAVREFTPCAKCKQNGLTKAMMTHTTEMHGRPTVNGALVADNACHKCGQAGHWSRECLGKVDDACNKCGQAGHWARECPVGRLDNDERGASGGPFGGHGGHGSGNLEGHDRYRDRGGLPRETTATRELTPCQLCKTNGNTRAMMTHTTEQHPTPQGYDERGPGVVIPFPPQFTPSPKKRACPGCGMYNHTLDQCRHRNNTCKICGQIGHTQFCAVCPGKPA